MANTMTLISSQILASSAASVTFSSIPSTYTDLKLIASVRSDGSYFGEYALLSINGTSTSTDWSGKYMQGDGSSVGAASLANYALGVSGTSNTASAFSNNEIYIPNYNSTTAKSINCDSVTENNGTTSYTKISGHLWNVTGSSSPITSFTLSVNGGANFVQYSSFYLYGIKN